MTELIDFLRTEAETLQYAAFFGAMIILGLAEQLLAGSRSTVSRGRRWAANYSLTVINIMVLGVIPLSAIALADQMRAEGWGLLNSFPVPPLVDFIGSLLLRSLLAWMIHVAMHRVPLFWRIHQVHHSDESIDVSTTVRFHPLEFLISTPLLLLGVAMLGLSPLALIVYEILDAAMAVFTHANIKLPLLLDRFVGWFLVTPALHRIHHSTDPEQSNTNYGATFSIWDRLFRTYRTAKPDMHVAMKLGLREYRGRQTVSLFWMLSLPFRTPTIARDDDMTDLSQTHRQAGRVHGSKSQTTLSDHP